MTSPEITDRIHESVIIFSHWLREWVSLHLTEIAGNETESEEVQSLILKGAIERVQDPFQSPVFYSRLILVPKITGGMRPVIDLSILNTCLLVPHF
jgi:hypothetical protein